MSDSIASILNDLRRPRTPTLEPGLLSVFRTIIGLETALVLLGVIAGTLRRDGPPRSLLITNLLWLVLLLIYLSWPRLHERLGRWFLPPALLISGLMPLVDRHFLLQYIVNSGDGAFPFMSVDESGWRLLFFLLFPLVLTAWQYRLPQVLLFSIGTSAVGIGLTGAALGWRSSAFLDILPFSMGQGVILTLIGFVVLRMISAQRAQRAHLTEANEKLAQYASTVDQLATSRERNRLARELHDTLSHTLSALAVQLEAADSVWESAPEQAHTLLVKSIANARGGLSETRRALQDLRASPLEDLGLGLALRTLAESTAKRAGLELTLDVPKQVDGLSAEQEQGVYRIAQEAWENVVKHAGAQKVAVLLRHDDQARWRLTVRDDGQGFDQRQTDVNGHYGLQGMQERAAMLGAALQIESQAGKTNVQLVV
ncbi:MAG: sensor histidine kinase [Caldilineaceae bacterium]